MQRSDEKYQAYVQILKEELVPAMGCTEPIALAYAAAKAREVLGCIPDKVSIGASGSIIKNVKSVVVPNTGGLKGIEASAAAGAVAGDAGKILEVISQVTEAQKAEIKAYLDHHEIRVAPAPGDVVFDIIVTLTAGADTVRLRIADYHTNIILIEKNGETLLESGNVVSDSASGLTDRSCMSVEAIVDFVNTMDVEDVREIVQRQIDYNYAIAQDGITNDWGANIGKVLLEHYGNDIKIRARAMAAAGEKCRREFKFSVLDSALNYFPDGKGEEVLLQGVIDAWFEGEDGAVTVVDFKSDRVRPGGEGKRAEEYRPQLEAYSLALSAILGKPVNRQVLWFFATDGLVEL